MFQNILKEIKTTLIGTAMIIFGGYNLWYGSDHDNYLLIGSVVLGIMFWFFPDKILNALWKFVSNIFKKKSKEL